MENKFINRYNTFCKCLSNLEKSKHATAEADFVLAATVQNFNLTFDISWKVMKDILVKQLGILDFSMGSPREVLQKSFANNLIDDDIWLLMLKSRNHLAHDYDGELALQLFHMITNDYYDAMLKFADAAKKFYTTGFKELDSFV